MQGAGQHVALCGVIVDDAKPAVLSVVFGHELVAELRDISDLTADDEKFALLDLGCPLELARLPRTLVELLLDLSEKRLEAVEILARRAIGNFFGGPLFLAGFDMLQSRDVVAAGVPDTKLCQKGVVVEPPISSGWESGGRSQQAMDIKSGENYPRLGKRAEPIEPYGIKPLKDVAIFPVLRTRPWVSKKR